MRQLDRPLWTIARIGNLCSEHGYNGVIQTVKYTTAVILNFTLRSPLVQYDWPEQTVGWYWIMFYIEDNHFSFWYYTLLWIRKAQRLLFSPYFTYGQTPSTRNCSYITWPLPPRHMKPAGHIFSNCSRCCSGNIRGDCYCYLLTYDH